MKNTLEQYHTVTISAAQNGKRLDQALAESLTLYSRSSIKKWIDNGKTQVNGQKTKPNFKVFEGDIVALTAIMLEDETIEPQPVRFEVTEVSQNLIIIDKPAGLVVHPAPGNRDKTLVNGLISRFPELSILPRAGLIHRIDKNTSGLLIVARDPATYQKMVRCMQKKEITRNYLGIVSGSIVAGDTIEEPIGRNRIQRTKMQVSPAGKKAITHFRVKKKFRDHTLIDIRLETGRTHQIRVHMAWKGHPLVGDKTYGWRPNVPKAANEELKQCIENFPRQALHAYKLSFNHPETSKSLEFRSEIPHDIEMLLCHLEADLIQ